MDFLECGYCISETMWRENEKDIISVWNKTRSNKNVSVNS